MTIDEFKMVDIPNGSKVVNIGCGPIPHTLLILAEVNDWTFLGIDKDKFAVEIAKEMVEYYHLSNKIEIRWDEGMKFDVSGFDLIIVSYGVEPKLKILEKLGDNMDKNSMILYRTTWDTLDRVYGDEPIPKNLEIKDSYDRIDGIKTFLLIRSKKNK